MFKGSTAIQFVCTVTEWMNREQDFVLFFRIVFLFFSSTSCSCCQRWGRWRRVSWPGWRSWSNLLFSSTRHQTDLQRLKKQKKTIKRLYWRNDCIARDRSTYFLFWFKRLIFTFIFLAKLLAYFKTGSRKESEITILARTIFSWSKIHFFVNFNDIDLEICMFLAFIWLSEFVFLPVCQLFGG